MKRLFVLTTVILITSFTLVAQDSKKEIKDFVNIELQLDNGWAGESLTLIEEKKKFFIIRKIFGSGVSIAETYKYAVKFHSPSLIEFWEIVSHETNDGKDKPKDEKFKLSITKNEISIYLNGIKLLTEIKTLPNKD